MQSPKEAKKEKSITKVKKKKNPEDKISWKPKEESISRKTE